MIRVRHMAAACIAAAPLPAMAQSPDVTRFEVAGIPVIYKPIQANDVVAVRMYLRGGSASLTSANAGIESMMLALAEQGTRKYDKDAFASLATTTGTNIGSEAGVDFSVLTMQGVRQNWEKAWDLFTQAALAPTFPESEVELVRGQLVNAVKRRSDDPDNYLTYLADSLFYAGHPYSAVPAGTEASLKSITRDALMAWHRQRMTKDNLLLVVVGNVPRADLEAKVRQAFGGLPATGVRPRSVAAVTSVTPELITIQRELPTNYITGYFHAPALTSADFPAFRAAMDMLGYRLFEEVRTKRNLTYAVGAGLANSQANRGRLYVTAVAPDTTMKVIFSTVSELQTGSLDPARLAETTNSALTRYLMGQQTNMGQAAVLGLWEISGGGWQNYSRFIESYKRVTASDVQRVARQYLTRGRFVLIGDPTKLTRGIVLAF